MAVLADPPWSKIDQPPHDTSFAGSGIGEEAQTMHGAGENEDHGEDMAGRALLPVPHMPESRWLMPWSDFPGSTTVKCECATGTLVARAGRARAVARRAGSSPFSSAGSSIQGHSPEWAMATEGSPRSDLQAIRCQAVRCMVSWRSVGTVDLARFSATTYTVRPRSLELSDVAERRTRRSCATDCQATWRLGAAGVSKEGSVGPVVVGRQGCRKATRMSSHGCSMLPQNDASSVCRFRYDTAVTGRGKKRSDTTRAPRVSLKSRGRLAEV